MITAPAAARERTVAKARVLLDALSFMREHRSKTIVVKVGGAAMEAEGIDRLELADVAGTIAGDNAILVLGREGVRASRGTRLP